MSGLGRTALILGFDCVLRRIALEQAGLGEAVGRIYRDHRVAGFNTYGEQHGGLHVNQTFVGLAFLEPERGMLRPTDDDARRIEKLTRINEALIQRLDRMDEMRGSSYALTRTAAMLEREIVARNADLERALAELSASNAELAAARETADEANRAKSRFLRAASHDLLQPLSAAKLFLGAPGARSRRTRCRPTSSSGSPPSFDSAEELIRALLDIARLDSRAFEANPGPVAIGRLFQRLAIDLQPLAAARGIDLRFVMSSEAVLSDPVLLRQIAQNLIINALKYSSGPKVRRRAASTTATAAG